MKKKWIIISSAAIALALILGLKHASYVKARSALQSEWVRQQIVPFFHPDHFMSVDNNTGRIVPTPIVQDNGFLSIEPNTEDLCWTFTLASWDDAVTIYVSLFGNPVSIGRIKYMETEPTNAPYSSPAAGSKR